MPEWAEHPLPMNGTIPEPRSKLSHQGIDEFVLDQRNHDSIPAQSSLPMDNDEPDSCTELPNSRVDSDPQDR